MSEEKKRIKLQVVKGYLSGRWSIPQVAERHGVNASSVRAWVALYNRHGPAGFDKRYRSYDAAFKLEVLKAVREKALSYQQAALQFGVRDLAVVGQWARLYDQGGAAALEPRRKGRRKNMQKMPPNSPDQPEPPSSGKDGRSREELLKELEYLRMENAYLKKLDALVQAKKLTAQQKKRS
jgi:transposase